MKIFSTKIQDIIGQVRDKLSKDSKEKEQIVQIVPRVTQTDENATKQNPQLSQQRIKASKDSDLVAVKYEHAVKAYEDILSAVGDYFDLFRANSDLLEDLWLQVLAQLKFRPPTRSCIIQCIHYELYNKHVILHPIINLLFKEGEEACSTKVGSANFQNMILKIKEIRDFRVEEETYEKFRARFKSPYDFNLHAANLGYAKEELNLRRKQQNQQQQQPQNQQATGGQ